MAARLPFGEHVFAEKSNHWIMQDQPDLVIRAVHKVVESLEKASSEGRGCVGIGPFVGTIALGLHTAGVLGKL